VDVEFCGLEKLIKLIQLFYSNKLSIEMKLKIAAFVTQQWLYWLFQKKLLFFRKPMHKKAKFLDNHLIVLCLQHTRCI